jgi:hypothetical protein
MLDRFSKLITSRKGLLPLTGALVSITTASC